MHIYSKELEKDTMNHNTVLFSKILNRERMMRKRKEERWQLEELRTKKEEKTAGMSRPKKTGVQNGSW